MKIYAAEAGIIPSVFCSTIHTPYRGPAVVVSRETQPVAYSMVTQLINAGISKRNGIFIVDPTLPYLGNDIISVTLGNIGPRDVEYQSGDLIAELVQLNNRNFMGI